MSKKINISYLKTKVGELVFGSFEGKICILDFRYRKKRELVDNRIKRYLGTEFVEVEDEIIVEAKRQIVEYLKGERKIFNIPILTIGTSFQKRVWKELMNINYGETISYLELAKRINNPRAFRAVASANGANAIALVIPCHRVISSDGSLGGYGGGLEAKKFFIELENKNF